MKLRDLDDLPHAVYRAYDADGHLLYVGVTCDPDQRIDAHARGAAWAGKCERLTLTWYEGLAAAIAAEAEAIRSEHPAHNVAGKPPGPPPVRITLNLPPDLYRQVIRWAGTAAEMIEVHRVSVQDALRAMIRATLADTPATVLALDQLRQDRD